MQMPRPFFPAFKDVALGPSTPPPTPDFTPGFVLAFPTVVKFDEAFFQSGVICRSRDQSFLGGLALCPARQFAPFPLQKPLEFFLLPPLFHQLAR